MRAKFVLQSVEKFKESEKLTFSAVGPKTNYPADGSDENNTYAKFTPSASCQMLVTNPDLLGKHEPGTEFYVDFTKVG